MKLLNLFFITFIFQVLACSNLQSNRPLKTEYYVEIINLSSNIFSKENIKRIEKSLIDKSYVLNKNGEIVLEERNKERLDLHHNKPHRFHKIQGDYSPQLGDVKVKVYLNKLNQAGEKNVDLRYLHYERYKKSSIWVIYLNPGNFRFDKGIDGAEIADSIARFIVVLTFK